MATIIPKPIAQWIKDDPYPDDRVAARQATITAAPDGKFKIILRGGGPGDMRYTAYTVVDEVDSGISAGGSMPNGWERAVDHFMKLSMSKE